MRLPEPSPSQLTEPEAMKALAEALQQAEQLETFAEVVSPPRSALHHSSRRRHTTSHYCLRCS